mmetsp:Transcript_13567/g.33347  ORF Transcript_13567/g.33347 Transcript_13567/m.33347 type:complete len:203 (+) Transcript_13567:1864-2472(+)
MCPAAHCRTLPQTGQRYHQMCVHASAAGSSAPWRTPLGIAQLLTPCTQAWIAPHAAPSRFAALSHPRRMHRPGPCSPPSSQHPGQRRTATWSACQLGAHVVLLLTLLLHLLQVNWVWHRCHHRCPCHTLGLECYWVLLLLLPSPSPCPGPERTGTASCLASLLCLCSSAHRLLLQLQWKQAHPQRQAPPSAPPPPPAPCSTC